MSGRADALPRITDPRPKRLRTCLVCNRRFLTVPAIRTCKTCKASRLALGIAAVEASRVVVSIRGWD